MLTRIRYAIRSLSKAPLLSLIVVLSLGLGIGANTAIFSLLHQVVLRSLPVQRPNELVLLTAPANTKGGNNSTGGAGGMEYIFSYPMFRELEMQPAGLTGLAAFRQNGANLAYGSQTAAGNVLLVSGGYFPVLGTHPLIGRFITPADDLDNGGNPVAVLGYGYWHDRLTGDEQVLNRGVRINGQLFTIVGVAPPNFTGTTLGDEPSAFVPLSFKPVLTPGWAGATRWDEFWLYLVGRLKPGVTMEQAQAGLNSKFQGLVETQAKSVSWYDRGTADRVRQSRLTLKEGGHGNSSFRDNARVPVLILMTATALVLLIAIANSANLLLARSAERRRELAIRAALGASRGEIAGQFLTEALLLAFTGGLCGLLFGSLTLQLLLTQIEAGSDGPSYFLTSHLELPVLFFSLGISLLTGLLFGSYPAWEAARTSVAATLKDEGNQSSGTRRVTSIRKMLVAGQVVVAAILLVPAGLFLKSVVNLVHVDLGIRTQNVLTYSLSPVLNGYKPEQSRALFERVESEIAAIPGVSSVSAAMVPVLGNDRWGNDVKIEGRAASESQTSPHAWYNEIGPGYFGKMGIPLISGREFSESDDAAEAKVAVVNEEFVRRFYPNRNPVGMHFGGWAPDIQVVGVVKDSHYASVREKPYPAYYVPWRQDKQIGSLSFYVRTALPITSMITPVRAALAHIDRDLPAEHLQPLEEQINSTISNDRIVLRLTLAFAILATLLAMLGLYGVMSHSVTRRTGEIGIRMAIGASPASIRGMILREMLRILGIGLGLGIPAALALGRYTESQLYGVQSYDTQVVVYAALALSLTAIAAAYLPARRASLVSPISALRNQ
jgi:putative ABC transport system permease protein